MAEIIAFPRRPLRTAFSPSDLQALEGLVARMRRRGAIGFEIDTDGPNPQAYVVGAEGETLLIVGKTADGISIRNGFAGDTLWTGRDLAHYA